MKNRSPRGRFMKQVRRQAIIDTKLGVVNAFSSYEKGMRTKRTDESQKGGAFEVGNSIIGGNDRIK